VYSEYLAAHAGYLRGRAAEEEEEVVVVPVASSSASAAAAAWRAEKSRTGELEVELARDRAYRVLLFGVAAAVLVQATEVAMETAGEEDAEEAKPPCCQTPTR
jgi:hypothetical protein